MPGWYTASSPDLSYSNLSNVTCDQFTKVSGLHTESKNEFYLFYRASHSDIFIAARKYRRLGRNAVTPSDDKDHSRTTASLNWFNDLNITSSSSSPTTLHRIVQILHSQALSKSHQRYDIFSSDTGSLLRLRLVSGPVAKLCTIGDSRSILYLSMMLQRKVGGIL